MSDYPLDPSRVLRNRSSAMRYLKTYKVYLRKQATALGEDILALGEDLREPVAFLVDALAQDCGNFWAKNIETDENGIGRGLVIHHVDFDDDVVDAYEARFGEDALERAAEWILKRLNGETSILVSWALGPIQFQESDNLTALEDRISFNLRTRAFESVLSHQDWSHPDCIHYHVKGGKSKKGQPFGRHLY